MLPQVHFNFGPTSVDKLYQIFLPLIPGSLVVAGTFVLKPALGARLLTAGNANLYVWLGVLAFFSYVVGYILFGLSGVVAGFVSGVVQLLVSRVWNPQRPNFMLSQRPVWRKVAGEFLGKSLSPVEVPPPPAITSANVGAVGSMFKATVDATMEHNAQWQEWYNVLQDYVLRNTPILSADATFVLIGFQATGWAMVYLSILSGHTLYWAVTVLGWVFIVIGSMFNFFMSLAYASEDRLTYWNFVARLLAETRADSTPPVANTIEKER